jgi:plastocyanin
MPTVPRLPRRLPRVLGAAAIVALLALAFAACDSGPAASPESFDPNSPQITASGEKFDAEELHAPANEGFEIVLFNRDSESHNLSIYSDASHSQRVFGGAITGSGTKVYHVQALAAGTYYFQCDIHPAMKGTLVVDGG